MPPDPSRVLASMPSRALTIDDVDALATAFPEHVDIMPASISQAPAGDRVTVATIVHRNHGVLYAVGYSETTGAWVRVGSWERDDYDEADFQATVQAWLRDEYGEDAAVTEVRRGSE